MKRVFYKIDKRGHGTHSLSSTPENCRDLLWFIDRYPLDISTNDLRTLKRGAKKYDDTLKAREEILSGRYNFADIEMAIKPREYQRQAAELWLRNGFLLLGDDVGVGKTGSAICGLVDKRTRPALVATLTHLTRQWAAEIRKFAPQLSSHILKQGTPYKIPGSPDILICNYHKLNGWSDELAGKVKSVVYDEIQELRRGESMKYSAAMHISSKAKFKLGLSATPIFNYGGEIVNVINALKDGALGDKDEFYREWCSYGGDEKSPVVDPKAFGTYLRENGIMLRRTRKDCGREIPAITIVPHTVDCDPLALDKIKGSASALAKIILSESPSARGEQFQAAGKFDMIVRQATGISKAPYVADFIRLLVESGESVLVFAWHRSVYDILGDALKDLEPVFYTGTESESQKNLSKQLFLEGKTKILIMSLRAGAGVDGLQKVCRTCVIAEPDWSPACHLQNIGRIARDGQTDPVTAYFLFSEEGSDPVIADILGIKKQQLEGIINPDQDIIEKVSSTGEHVKKLAQFYLDKANKKHTVVSTEVEFEIEDF